MILTGESIPHSWVNDNSSLLDLLIPLSLRYREMSEVAKECQHFGRTIENTPLWRLRREKIQMFCIHNVYSKSVLTAVTYVIGLTVKLHRGS